MNRFLFLLFILLINRSLLAQNSSFPLHSLSEKILRDSQIRLQKRIPGFSSDIRPYLRQKKWFSLDTMEYISPAYTYDMQFLKSDNAVFGTDTKMKDPSFWSFFYRSRRNFLEYSDSTFQILLNPVLHFRAGSDNRKNKLIFLNSRGLELEARLDNRISIYTSFSDNQAVFPAYEDSFRSHYGTYPALIYEKNTGAGSVDYMLAEAYVSFALFPHVNMTFGHGKNFIGNGYRSLFLSDFSHNYLFLRISTNVWKLHYQNIFAEFIDGSNLDVSPFKKKYGAFHYLSLDLRHNLNLAFFEGVIFSDIHNNGRGFELTYLNPVIFYRVLERNLNSADNALLGFNLHFIPFRRVSLYAQCILDEFKISEIRSGKGWWGNKHGIQIGTRLLDIFGLYGCNLQSEFNFVRPYAYSHKYVSSNYSHYNQALAHPLGANFIEWINSVEFRIRKNIFSECKIMYALTGTDSNEVNWGGNILLSYDTREQDYNNRTLQGIKNELLFLNVHFSWMFACNIFLDTDVIYRTSVSELKYYNYNSLIFLLSLRMNISRQEKVF